MEEKYNVLYVDDERENLIVFKAAFRDFYNVFTAVSAREGTKILTEQKIHLVITDQRMPEMTGVEFLESINHEYPDVIRMILTGFSGIENIIQAINKGRVYHYITKPWDRDELRITIDNALESYTLRLENKTLLDNLRQANQRLEDYAQELERKVEARTTEILHQKEIIEDKNKDIQASMAYAQKIQAAFLAKEDKIQVALPNSFILMKPCDIVSGDFYWFAEKENTIFIASIDCTGHGVPGAFMSLIANEMLNEIVNLKGINETHEILNRLRHIIYTALRQDQNESRDGLDIALCIIHKNETPVRVEFSGAKCSLIYIQNGILNEIKGDKIFIGGIADSDKVSFSRHFVEADPKTSFYIYSDGYQDQFGGEYGRKFMSKNFRELLFSLHQQPMKTQKLMLESHLKDWMGKEEQVDDILVIGFELPIF